MPFATVAVLSDRRVLMPIRLEKLTPGHQWIQEYFHGPRGRAAAQRPPSNHLGVRG